MADKSEQQAHSVSTPTQPDALDGEHLTYGIVEHGGEQYEVTSVSPRSKHFLRVWKAGAVGVDGVLAMRDPEAPEVDWYAGALGWLESKKAALVIEVLKVYREREAG